MGTCHREVVESVAVPGAIGFGRFGKEFATEEEDVVSAQACAVQHVDLRWPTSAVLEFEIVIAVARPREKEIRCVVEPD